MKPDRIFSPARKSTDLTELIDAAVGRAIEAAFARHRQAIKADILQALASGTPPADPADAGLLLGLGGRPDWLCSEAIAWAENSPTLKQAMTDADVYDKTSLGIWCRRMVDKTVDSMVLRRLTRAGSGRRWTVVRTV
jgi:hypothetical protein